MYTTNYEPSIGSQLGGLIVFVAVLFLLWGIGYLIKLWKETKPNEKHRDGCGKH